MWVHVRTEAVLTSTHTLCFGAKIRKIGIPLHTPVLLYKSGVKVGDTLHGHVFMMITCCIFDFTPGFKVGF